MLMAAGQTTLTALDSASFMGGIADDVAIRFAASVNASINPMGGMRAYDSAASSTNAFLVSELEKRDPLVRKPLTTYTWADNIPVNVGGGWTEFKSALNIGYGSAGADDDANVNVNGATVAPVIQANFGKDIWKTHVFMQPMSINEIDMLRMAITGRNLDTLLSDGVRLAYEKHMDKNVFAGLSKYGTTGLINNPSVFASLVAAGGEPGSPTQWQLKNADEILADVNDAIIETWNSAGNDMGAIPNHILLPFDQHNILISRKASQFADKSIMDYLMENNIASKHGENLVFGVSLWGKGAGTGGTDRMVVYRYDNKFLAVDELVPLTRLRTMPSVRHVSYDTNYVANISEVQIFYPAAIRYYDGI